MKPTVSKITVARLFNCGNYEHERIEIEVRPEDGAAFEDPLQTLDEVRAAVGACAPVKEPYGLDRARQFAAGQIPTWNGEGEEPECDWVSPENGAQLLEMIQKHEAEVVAQRLALESLRRMGTVNIRVEP